MHINEILQWFAGGPDGYMTLVHCMNHDTFWIVLTVVLDVLIYLGYLVIALHWWRNERPLKDGAAKSALRSMKNIFLFCGLCGYLFIPIMMVWPAWRLYDAFLAVLVYYTWRYALHSRQLGVVYNELGRAERLVKDLEETREESQRKSFFLNAISHDLKTPLNGLTLQAELAELNLSANDNEALRDALREIKNCARTTAELLDSFMEIGRLDWSDSVIEPGPVDLAELVRGVAARHRPRAEQKGLRLLCTVPSRFIAATDRMKVERILTKLVDNAVKFTCAGVVELAIETRAAEVAIHVSDTGEGISTEHQASIFNDFFQVHNTERDSRNGFGLGLSIARRLAGQLGGGITVESDVGRGSRFTLRLPSIPAGSRTGGTVAGGRESTVTGQTASAAG